MGKTDAPEGWQAAIDTGADGIQTDRPGPLVEYLRAKGYKENCTYLPFRHPLDVVGRGDSREELRGLCMAH
jgi:hypothetical protein